MHTEPVAISHNRISSHVVLYATRCGTWCHQKTLSHFRIFWPRFSAADTFTSLSEDLGNVCLLLEQYIGTILLELDVKYYCIINSTDGKAIVLSSSSFFFCHNQCM